MTSFESKELEINLLSLKKGEIIDWLDRCSSKEITLPAHCDSNWWSSIAHTLASRSKSVEPWDLDWAKIAIAFYEYLQDPVLTTSSMAFRLDLIRQHGTQQQQNILDPQVIIQWFENSVQSPPEKAAQISQQWRDGLASGDPYTKVSNDDILEIRGIKNKLNIIKELLSISSIKSTENLLLWLQLHQQLV